MNTTAITFVTEFTPTTVIGFTDPASYASNQSNPSLIPLKTIQTIVLPLIYSIVCVVGLLGNGLVINIMHLKNRHRNITDLYVLNLAIADFIFVSMLPFWTTEIALQRWVFGHVMCKLASGFTYFHMYASVFFLTAMSVDRFVAVVLYQSCRRTKKNARIAVVFIWFTSAILGLLPLFFRGVSGGEPPKCEWTFIPEILSHYIWFVIYFVTRSIIGFVIPCSIIAVSYSLVICFLKGRNSTGKVTNKRQDRATKMVLVVIAVFLLCWLPNQISNFIYVVDALHVSHPDEKEPPAAVAITHYYIHMFSTCLTWMHSCVNPILYAFMRQDMRAKFAEIVNKAIKHCCGDTSRDTSESVRKNHRNFSSVTSLPTRNPRTNRQSVTESVRLSTIAEKPCSDGGIEERKLITTEKATSPSECRPDVCVTHDKFPEVTARVDAEVNQILHNDNSGDNAHQRIEETLL